MVLTREQEKAMFAKARIIRFVDKNGKDQFFNFSEEGVQQAIDQGEAREIFNHKINKIETIDLSSAKIPVEGEKDPTFAKFVKASVSSKVTGREKEKQDILKKLRDKGFKLTTEFSKDPDDPEDEGTEFTTITLTEKQTLDAINGKRSALEINDFITGTTEDERLRHDIDVSNNLAKLEKEGKIKIENGVWKKVT